MTYEVLIGDCIESMKTLESESVHTCITSPPYFGLRDYGHEGQIGLEPTPDEFVQKLVEVFREVRRVLRDDGTVWLNLGDSYASYRDAKCSPNTIGGGQRSMPTSGAINRSANTFKGTSIKHKDLIGIPWRVAFALQEDGWYLRQDIIWHKPNPMPESVKDRCTKSHEYIFLLSKSNKYYYDYEAIREPAAYDGRKDEKLKGSPKYADSDYMMNGNPNSLARVNRDRWIKDDDGNRVRNKRSVWTVTTRSYKGAHFATFPPDLIEPCVLAGCPEGGVVLDPFGGSGTTAGVAIKHNRKAVLCELNENYANLIPDRVKSILSKSNQVKSSENSSLEAFMVN